jgi:hypothetical protein
MPMVAGALAPVAQARQPRLPFFCAPAGRVRGTAGLRDMIAR